MRHSAVGLAACALVTGVPAAGATTPSSRLAEAVATYAPSVRIAQARQNGSDMST